jgi:hypothetical protein
MDVELGISRGTPGQMLVKPHHWFTEQHLLVFVGRPMGVELHKKPVRPAGDLDPGPEPQIQAGYAGRLAPLQAGIFDMG